MQYQVEHKMQILVLKHWEAEGALYPSEPISDDMAK